MAFIRGFWVRISVILELIFTNLPFCPSLTKQTSFEQWQILPGIPLLYLSEKREPIFIGKNSRRYIVQQALLYVADPFGRLPHPFPASR